MNLFENLMTMKESTDSIIQKLKETEIPYVDNDVNDHESNIGRYSLFDGVVELFEPDEILEKYTIRVITDDENESVKEITDLIQNIDINEEQYETLKDIVGDEFYSLDGDNIVAELDSLFVKDEEDIEIVDKEDEDDEEDEIDVEIDEVNIDNIDINVVDEASVLKDEKDMEQIVEGKKDNEDADKKTIKEGYEDTINYDTRRRMEYLEELCGLLDDNIDDFEEKHQNEINNYIKQMYHVAAEIESYLSNEVEGM